MVGWALSLCLCCGCAVCRCAGGRWDYIFSFIKKLRAHPRFVLPERRLVTMASPFMAAYVRLLIHTCHRRGVHAMGGMAAQIPIKGDSQANAAAMQRVRADKQREVALGHDGTWVAHPALVPVAREVFDRTLQGRPHQIPPSPATGGAETVKPSHSRVTAVDLLTPPMASPLITLAGVKANVSVCLSYISPWLCGVGCVPLDYAMEDAATAEISRCQLWQWKTHRARTEEGQTITTQLLIETLHEVRDGKRREVGEKRWMQGRWGEAATLIERLLTAPDLADFLTLEAYPLLNTSTAPHTAPALTGRNTGKL